MLQRTYGRSVATGAAFARRSAPTEEPRRDAEKQSASRTKGASSGTAPPQCAASPTTTRACFLALGMEPATRAGQYCADDVKTAYKRAARSAHPDMPTGSEGDFRNVQRAYEYLKQRPGVVANDSAVMDADGKPTAAPSGFYAHPHNSRHNARGGGGHTQYTTRTRWNDEQGRPVEDTPDAATAEFLRFAKGWHEATRQGRGNEFLRQERERRAKARADAHTAEGQRRASMSAAERDREDFMRHANVAIGLWRAMKLAVVGVVMYCFGRHCAQLNATAAELHSSNKYPDWFVENMKNSTTASVGSSEGKGADTQPIAPAERAKQYARAGKAFEARHTLSSAPATHAVRFKGKSFDYDVMQAENEQRRATRTGKPLPVKTPATPSDPRHHPREESSAGPQMIAGTAAPMTLESLSDASRAFARQSALATTLSPTAVDAEAAALVAGAGEAEGECLDD